jgi:hypothetical protein
VKSTVDPVAVSDKRCTGGELETLTEFPGSNGVFYIGTCPAEA